MRRQLALAGALAASLLLAATAAPVGAVHETGASFALHLHVDGSADVVVAQQYNSSNGSQNETFQRLASNATARERRVAAFRQRLERGAAAGQNATGREMTIRNASIETQRFDNGTGVVRLRAEWVGLAAVQRNADGDDYVVVTEPFASGFPLNRTLAVHGPEGFVRAGMNPPPAVALRNSAMWGPNANFTGFQASFAGDLPGTATQGDAKTPTPEQGAGAFLGAVVLALVPTFAVALALRRID